MADTDSSIGLWLVDLDACAHALELVERDVPRVPADDRERAEALADGRERRHRLAAHTALRVLIEQVAGPGARGLSFVRGPGAKPALPDGSAEFNISHSEGLALVGVSRVSPLGIDLEKVRPARMSPQRLGEITAIGAGLGGKLLPALGAPRTFIQAWARLEAFAKARGSGLARTLADLGVRGREGVRLPLPHLEAAARQLAHAEGLAVRDVPLPPAFHGAVAAPRGAHIERVRAFPADRAAINRLLAAQK